MSANPQLSQVPDHDLIPLPFEAEHLLLSRQVEFYLDGVRTQSGSWSARGHLFLSSLRLILVADKEDNSGEAAYEGISWLVEGQVILISLASAKQLPLGAGSQLVLVVW